MFFSQTFEPHSPLSPQFFPRPTTDAYESQLDPLERFEENRKQRLRSIATVAARTPIGLHDVSSAGSGTVNHNAYNQHRYYPPPSHEAVASFVPSDAPAHPTAATTRRRYLRASRRGNRTSESSLTAHQQTAEEASNNNLSHLSHSHISHDDPSRSSLHSFHLSPFSSPPLDPRGGGGSRRSSVSHWTMLYRQSLGETPRGETVDVVTPRNFFGVATTSTTMLPDEDLITPEDRGVSATPGHGAGEDVYSQRVGRRRRRDVVDS